MTAKHLHVKALGQLADFCYRTYFVKLPPEATFEDLFIPTFWAHHKGKLSENDLVRVVAHDQSFDLTLVVVATPNNCAVMRVHPHFKGETGAAALDKAGAIAEASRLVKVPLDRDGQPVVRVQHLPATGWRVLGLEGAEIARDLKTEDEARKAMNKYLADARLEMPTPEELSAVAAKKAEKADAAKSKTKAA